MRYVAAATMILTSVVLLAGAQSPAGAPPQSTPLAVLSGQIVDEESRRPLPNARVSIAAEGLGAPVVLTDAEGRFAIDVVPGRYTVTASKPGYGPTNLSATAGLTIQVLLRRGAVISGRVIDEYGDPVLAARVTAETSPDTQPDRRFTTTAETDDRGDFRLTGLPSGSFVVSVARTRNIADAFQQDRQNSTVKTYYPGVSEPGEAEQLHVGPGEERAAVDFTVPADTSISQPFNVASMGPPRAPATSTNAASASATIRGQVLSADGGALPFALVRLISQKDGRQSFLTRAGSDGRFEFSGLPAGAFRLLASKVGYVPGASAESAPRSFTAGTGGRGIDLAAGQVREDIKLTLARWTSLTGHIRDEYGDPVQGASIQLLQVRYERGRRQLVQTDGSNRTSDERGEYRIYGITPGRYVVSAVVGVVFTADVPGYVRSYSPGTADASAAQIVTIGASEDVTGVDIALTRVPTARVAGQMLNASGEPSGSGSLMLLSSQRSSSVTSVSVGARILPDGRFEFPNVPPGQYVIQSNRGRPNRWTEGEFAAVPVTVNGVDIKDLVVQTSAGSTITGHFTFNSFGETKTPSPSNLVLIPQPADFDLTPTGNFATAAIEADWTFRLAGITGPRRLQLTRIPAGWTLERILAHGVDITDRPLLFGRDDQSLDDVEVVLTDRVSQVKGSVADDRGLPTAATVVLFPTDEARWYPASRFLRTAIVRADGTFNLAALPPGTYHIAAAAQMPPWGADGWQDPEFLSSLIPAASTLTLNEGQSVTATLKLASR